MSRCLFALLLLPASLARAQDLRLTHAAATSTGMSLAWDGGSGPYLVEVSRDLLEWSDQGDPSTEPGLVLPTNAPAAFYRVRDLGAAGQVGPFVGLLQTEQGEFGKLMARHRLKSRWWLHEPVGAVSTVPATFFRQLIVHHQFVENGRVTTLVGPLESLGTITTSSAAKTLTLAWVRGEGSARRRFTLTLTFPYPIDTARAAKPNPSDPTCVLACTYATAQPELDAFGPASSGLTTTTTDSAGLIQLAPTDPDGWQRGSYPVNHGGVKVAVSFAGGTYLRVGVPQMILKTYVLHSWAPTTLAGLAGLPAFATESYFARTYFPFHHNFLEVVLIEPALDPALGQPQRAALAAANIRYIYAFKDRAFGMSPDDIRLIGFDDTVREP